MGSPIDRTAKTALDSNLANGNISDAPKMKANNDVSYNYMDGLNAAQDAHAAAATLPHADSSVTGPKIRDGAVTTSKIADLAVTQSKIANGAVGASQLATGLAVTADTNAMFAKRGIDVTSAPYNAVGDGVTDDTTAIQNAINDASTNKTLVIFPGGTYKHTGLIVPPNSFLCGSGRTKSILKNTSTNPNLTVQGTTISIRDLGVIGDGTLTYGSDATTGEGILIDGSYSDGASYIEIDNCAIRFNGKEGIKFYKGCWIIDINRCFISKNKFDGIKIDGTDGGQKNIINMSKNDCSSNGKNGIFAWGTIINITENTLEKNQDAGINMDDQLLTTYQNFDINTINIVGNYFESNNLGHIYVRVGTYTTPSTIFHTINGMSIVGNYGYQNVAVLKSGLVSSVNMVNVAYFQDNLKVLGMDFSNNQFNLSNYTGYYVADFGNALAESCKVSFPEKTTQYYLNLGRALYLGVKQKVINGYFHAKGITYASPVKSDDVPDLTVITYPIDLPSQSVINNIKIYVDTDSTNYRVEFRVYRRSITGVGAYSSSGLINGFIRTMTAAGLAVATDPAAYGGIGRLLEDNADAYLQIKIYRDTAGTYLYLGHPMIYYVG